MQLHDCPERRRTDVSWTWIMVSIYSNTGTRPTARNTDLYSLRYQASTGSSSSCAHACSRMASAHTSIEWIGIRKACPCRIDGIHGSHHLTRGINALYRSHHTRCVISHRVPHGMNAVHRNRNASRRIDAVHLCHHTCRILHQSTGCHHLSRRRAWHSKLYCGRPCYDRRGGHEHVCRCGGAFDQEKHSDRQEARHGHQRGVDVG